MGMTGRREQAKARTRAAIIDAGIRLMHEHGYDATSTTAIARAAGVSPATLFNYFPTKSSIVFADNDAWSPSGVKVQAGATPRQTLVMLVLAMLDRPDWTRPVDHPLTVMRFELVRREPALAAAQISLAFDQVPAMAALLIDVHPELSQEWALTEAGAAIGAILAALTWTTGSDIRATVTRALSAEPSR